MTMVSTLEDLYVEELRELYDAEQQVLEALPKLMTAATNLELKEGFRDHIRETQDQVRRLEEIFDDLGESPAGAHCKGIEGLIEECDEILEMTTNPEVRDAALISAAQRIEHYEIAGYGTVRSYAKQLGHDFAASKLKETLDQESKTDKELTKIAEGTLFTGGVNEEAAS